MTCDLWKPHLAALACEDIPPADREALERHLATCEPCRTALARLVSTRRLIESGAGHVPQAPRVVVLGRARPGRAWLPFAAGVACALLVGAGAATGFAIGHSSGPVAAIDEARAEEIVRAALARRQAVSPASEVPAPSGVTRADLDAAFASFERRLDRRRTTDLEYLLDQISASEFRTGDRIGQTQQALRYVALANDPGLSPR